MKFKQSISEFICDTKYKQILNDLSTYDTVDSYEGILNIHRFDKHNIGDIKSAPYNYFTELKNFEVLDILGYKRIFSNHRIWFKKRVNNK